MDSNCYLKDLGPSVFFNFFNMYQKCAAGFFYEILKNLVLLWINFHFDSWNLSLTIKKNVKCPKKICKLSTNVARSITEQDIVSRCNLLRLFFKSYKYLLWGRLSVNDQRAQRFPYISKHSFSVTNLWNTLSRNPKSREQSPPHHYQKYFLLFSIDSL